MKRIVLTKYIYFCSTLSKFAPKGLVPEANIAKSSTAYVKPLSHMVAISVTVPTFCGLKKSLFCVS